MNIDTELLISEVEARRNLWDVGDEYYKDRDIRMTSWQDIAKTVVQNIEQMSEIEKKKAVDKVQQRLKSVRDAKIRSMANKKLLKSGSASKKKREYVYDKQLQFIESLVEPNRTESNLDYDDDDDNINVCEEGNQRQHDVGDEKELSTCNLNEPWKRKKNTGPKNQKTDAFEQEFLEALRKSSEEDEDKSFLDSLLPTIRLFNNDQKLIFRSRVLAMMIEVKNSATIQTYPPPMSTPTYLNYSHGPAHQEFHNLHSSDPMPLNTSANWLPLWTSIMSKSFEYGNLTASSASVESHINEIKHYSGIKSNIRVDDFIKHHTSYLEGSMKLASGLRYFQNPLGVNDDEDITHKNAVSEDEISISSDISHFVDDLNECENWGGKIDSMNKTKESQKVQLTKKLTTDNSVLNSPNNNLEQKSSNRSEDVQDSTVVCNTESDLLLLDSFQIDNDLISNISPDCILD